MFRAFIYDFVLLAVLLANQVNVSRCVFYLSASTTPTVLTSPRWPANYANNLDESWTIIAYNYGYVVRIRIDTLQLESTGGCKFDFISVYEGLAESNVLFKKCDSTDEGLVHTSSTDTMGISFHTDDTHVFQGFQISYWAVRIGTPSIDACSQTVYLTGHEDRNRQLLYSPGWPQKYPNNQDCRWVITTNRALLTEEAVVIVELLELNVELGQNGKCPSDYLLIKDGGSPSSLPYELVKWCEPYNGMLERTVVSTSNTLHIEFHSDASIGFNNGFKLKYYTAPTTPTVNPAVDAYKACDVGQMAIQAQDAKNIILSPPWPWGATTENPYECSWVITAEPNHVITLNLIDLELDYHTQCLYDYLTVKEGYPDSRNTLVRWCGPYSTLTASSSIISSSNTISIILYTDGTTSVTSQHFTLHYWQKNATVTPTASTNEERVTRLVAGVEKSNLYSPNFVNGYGAGYYESDSVYTWRIDTNDDNMVIRIDVVMFHLQDGVKQRCLFDSLEIRDGHDEFNSPILVTWCGVLTKENVTSTGRYMFIKLKTDGSYNYDGFQLRYWKVPKYDGLDAGVIAAIALCAIAVITSIVIIIVCGYAIKSKKHIACCTFLNKLWEPSSRTSSTASLHKMSGKVSPRPDPGPQDNVLSFGNVAALTARLKHRDLGKHTEHKHPSDAVNIPIPAFQQDDLTKMYHPIALPPIPNADDLYGKPKPKKKSGKGTKNYAKKSQPVITPRVEKSPSGPVYTVNITDGLNIVESAEEKERRKMMRRYKKAMKLVQALGGHK
ncbi:unnamed protein product [Owenia fusiformis]|uniref:Uncharacterized protein n=1 Tax=Owenia fusiformis TaxID=6347 RepID=A0A8J1XMN4_OWEFU|nr:unnamed protein product [Owenia fusiformis]